jgi:hypothetical protein
LAGLKPVHYSLLVIDHNQRPKGIAFYFDKVEKIGGSTWSELVGILKESILCPEGCFMFRFPSDRGMFQQDPELNDFVILHAALLGHWSEV